MKMICSRHVSCLIFIINLILIGPALSHQSKSLSQFNFHRLETKFLNVGDELHKETIPLQSGSRLYHLQGLKSHTWYEVKISYPASIPATFSLQLKRGSSKFESSQGRKLLNTEKLIFKTGSLDLLNNQDAMFILVTVEPEGFVAIPGVQERNSIMFNIGKRSCPSSRTGCFILPLPFGAVTVCDELYLGIPQKAWYVVVLVILCLVVSFAIPSFLPPHLLPRNSKKK